MSGESIFLCFHWLRTGLVAQVAGDGEVGPVGSGQVLQRVVAGLGLELLDPAVEVRGPQVPVGHAALATCQTLP